MIKQFNRFELKYVVPVAARDAFLEELYAHVSPDPGSGSGSSYAVTSLYYDSPDLTCLRAKLDGIRFRRKLRVRCYGEITESNPPAMVEIKQRIGRTTQKRRLALPLEDALRLCACEYEPLGSDPADAIVAAEVEFLARSLRLRPACVIGYVRNAFVGSRYEPGLRVTLDRGLWSALPPGGLTGETARHFFLSPDLTVLEVKVNDAVPLWLSNLLARHHCSLTRYSKYCAGLLRLIELGQWHGTDLRSLEDGQPLLKEMNKG